MAHLQVAIDTDKLEDLFASDEGIAALAEQILNQVLEAQMTEHLQAKPYRRSPTGGPSGAAPTATGINPAS